MIKIMLKNFFGSTFFTGSLLMFISLSVVNAGNYLFHLLSGRLLGPTLYGTLQSIISTLYLLNIIPLALSIIVMKFVALYGKDQEKINTFFNWLNLFLLKLSIIVTTILLVLVPLWMKFLKIDNPLSLIMAVLIVPVSLFTLASRSFLQGQLKFFALCVSLISEIFLKVFLMLIFIKLGWAVMGAVLSIIVSLLLSWIITTVISGYNFSFKQKYHFPQKREIFSYSVPVVVSTVAFSSLYTTDIILVKHFFTSFEAGIYASLSVLGKVVYFASFPINNVMFPLVANKYARKESYENYFILSIIIVLLISTLISAVYLFFPQLMIGTLYGTKFLGGSGLLFLFGLFISLYALANTLNNFYLSVGKTRISFVSLIFSILQIVGLYFFHDSLKTVIVINIVISFLMVVCLLLYYPYVRKK